MEDDTLRMLGDAVSAFTAGSSTRVRKARSLEGGYDTEVLKRMADQGWISAFIPENRGGLGLGCQAVSVISYGLGRAAIPEPYIAAGVLPAMMLSLCQSDTAAYEKLSLITSGHLRCALAWQSVSGSLDPRASPLTARSDSNGAIISGAAHFLMTSGFEAVLAVVINDGVPELYWVPVSLNGISIEKNLRSDWGHDCVIHFNEVRVPGENLISQGVDVEDALRTTIDMGLIAVASELNGLTERMLDMTLDYMKTRNQFGKPIGSFQALKHRAVDMWIQCELAKAASQDAAKQMDDDGVGSQECSLKASGAKSRASDVSLFVGKQAIQMHGAIGVTDEYDLSIYFNRALALSAYLGNGSFHRARYASLKGRMK